MPDVLLFGATGYTGRLTTQALARRGVDFAIAGRDRSKLERLASENGDPEIRVASVGDVDSLVNALDGVKAMITCVGPFLKLGDTAVQAALEAKCHYIDSTGEGTFIERLVRGHDADARQAGIAMAPALGFDEVPADVTTTLATEGLDNPDVVLTYALPSAPSRGTAKSVVDIITSAGPWLVDGRRVDVTPGQYARWSPMPSPLGPRYAISFPLAEAQLAPLHLDLNSLRLFVTVGRAQAAALKAMPVTKAILSLPGARAGLEAVIERTISGPGEKARGARWTILGEARAVDRRRNVVLSGRDVYGLTAEMLAAAAVRMSEPDFNEVGVIAPVQAVGIDRLQKELIELGVSIEIYES
ncbi:MAG: saccharopine dehydrogenase NADP-binding domain-containing protein [Actinomycetota bacterium]|nr:saccharopine dehydrogenase NADP-binding domain-containing protein [Actinomycetota bacterium]